MVWETSRLGECSNAHDLLQLVRQKKWDVVILDIGMPETTGTDALVQVKRRTSVATGDHAEHASRGSVRRPHVQSRGECVSHKGQRS